jgi:hypothetical protein
LSWSVLASRKISVPSFFTPLRSDLLLVEEGHLRLGVDGEVSFGIEAGDDPAHSETTVGHEVKPERVLDDDVRLALAPLDVALAVLVREGNVVGMLLMEDGSVVEESLLSSAPRDRSGPAGAAGAYVTFVRADARRRSSGSRASGGPDSTDGNDLVEAARLLSSPSLGSTETCTCPDASRRPKPGTREGE